MNYGPESLSNTYNTDSFKLKAITGSQGPYRFRESYCAGLVQFGCVYTN